MRAEAAPALSRRVERKASTMLEELLRISGVLVFAVSLLRLREVFLSVRVGEGRKGNGQNFNN